MRYLPERWFTWEWERREEGLQRYYQLTVQQNLWGEWEVLRSWGRIGQRPSRKVLQIVPHPEAAEAIAQEIDHRRQKRGYRRC